MKLKNEALINMKLKKLFLIGLSLLFVTTLFGQTYEEYLAKAKQYEAENAGLMR